MRLRSLVVLLLGVLALFAAGCGGDDSSAAAEETVVEETTPTTEETTSGDETATSGEVDLDDLSGECLELAGVGAKFAEAIQASGTGDLSAYVDAFDEFANAAPDEISDDIRVIGKALGEVAEVLKGVDLTSGAAPSAEQIAKLQEIGAAFDDPELKAASDRIEAWVGANCSNS